MRKSALPLRNEFPDPVPAPFEEGREPAAQGRRQKGCQIDVFRCSNKRIISGRVTHEKDCPSPHLQDSDDLSCKSPFTVVSFIIGSFIRKHE